MRTASSPVLGDPKAGEAEHEEGSVPTESSELVVAAKAEAQVAADVEGAEPASADRSPAEIEGAERAEADLGVAPTEPPAAPTDLAVPADLAAAESTEGLRSCEVCGRSFPADYAVCPHDATPLSAPVEPNEDPLIGRTVSGAFQIRGIIGEGGMGRVYEAVHVRLPGRLVAVKVLHPELCQKAELIARIQREVEVVSTLDHPAIVRLLDWGEVEAGRPFLVFERVQGTDLAAHLADKGPFDPGRAVELAIRLADALECAHQHGVIHRDLKPENILLSGDEVAPMGKIIDFGVSKIASRRTALTRTGLVVGTPVYMSPEQASGMPVDARSDVYALGTLIYEMLTGRPPFPVDEAAITMTRVLTEQPVPLERLRPDVPAPLALVVSRAMAKAPSKRYASAADLASDLRMLAEPSLGQEEPTVPLVPGARRQPAVTVASMGLHEGAGRANLVGWLVVLAFIVLGLSINAVGRAIVWGAERPIIKSELALVVVGIVLALATPAVLIGRYIARHVWDSAWSVATWRQEVRGIVLWFAGVSCVLGLVRELGGMSARHSESLLDAARSSVVFSALALTLTAAAVLTTRLVRILGDRRRRGSAADGA